jgi:1-acyl-sn-glycerol-3-phosphate acyltransferase
LNAEIKKLLAAYDRLDPNHKGMARLELLKRAIAEEWETKAARPIGPKPAKPKPAKPGPGEVKSVGGQKTSARPGSDLAPHFTAPSDQFLDYLRNLVDALRPYLLYDEYKEGDENRLDLIRKETLRAMEPLVWLLKTYFRYEVFGLENIPRKGRAIIVSNHGLLPVDGWFLSYEILRASGRWPRGLTDWRIYRIPLLRQLFMDMGAMVGSHENGDALLQQEELIFIMPGGAKEAWKSSKYRYRLLWHGRYGFIRLALRNRTPIIPSANVGTDDTYRVFFDGYTTARKLFGTKNAMFPISLPVGLGILPFPAKMTQYVGTPIQFPYPPEAEHDSTIVSHCQEVVKSKVYELIDRGLREKEERRTR